MAAYEWYFLCLKILTLFFLLYCTISIPFSPYTAYYYIYYTYTPLTKTFILYLLHISFYLLTDLLLLQLIMIFPSLCLFTSYVICVFYHFPFLLFSTYFFIHAFLSPIINIAFFDKFNCVFSFPKQDLSQKPRGGIRRDQIGEPAKP